MLTEPVSLYDGVSLARSVRQVAARAQLLLMNPIDPVEACDLLDAIASLEHAAKARSSEELVRWLCSLRNRIQTHGGTALRENRG